MSICCNGFDGGVAIVMNLAKNGQGLETRVLYPDGTVRALPGNFTPYGEHFREGLAAQLANTASGECKFGFLDRDLNWAIAPTYELAEDFHEGRASVTLDGKMGYIDTSGTLVVPCQYEGERCLFSGGVAALWQNNRVGVIDKMGNTVIPFEYDCIDDVGRGGRPFVAKKGTTWFLLDPATGKELLRLELAQDAWSSVHHGEGLFSVERRAERFGSFISAGCLDETGKVVIPFGYHGMGRFCNGLAIVQRDDRYGVIDRAGKAMLPLEYDFICRDGDGVFIAQKGGRLELYDADMSLLFATDFEGAQEDCWYGGSRLFCDGLLALRQNGKWGYVDRRGETVVPFDYDGASPFREGLAAVFRDGTWSVLHRG